MAKLAAVTDGAPPDRKRKIAACATSTTTIEQKQRDAAGRERLELAVAVRMICVGRLLREPQPHERDDVRRAVGQRMKPVGENADGSAELAEDDLRQRDGEVQEKNADENGPNGTRVERQLRIGRLEDW